MLMSATRLFAHSFPDHYHDRLERPALVGVCQRLVLGHDAGDVQAGRRRRVQAADVSRGFRRVPGGGRERQVGTVLLAAERAAGWETRHCGVSGSRHGARGYARRWVLRGCRVGEDLCLAGETCLRSATDGRSALNCANCDRQIDLASLPSLTCVRWCRFAPAK